ncbi:MAG: hypothetical protein ACI80V_000773 [Rhodothermales bacterium]|jgi:hypothetical protein
MEEEEFGFGNHDRLEEAFRPPMMVTLVFVLTMLSIYMMGRQVTSLFPSLGI